MPDFRADVAVIGGGIVGLATAYRLGQQGRRVVVLDKEDAVGQHQTGHNSGVLHTGIYYVPGSLKATTCRAGKAAMQAFCEAEAIPFDVCGKVIVATKESELPALARIEERGRANGVVLERIGRERLAEIEPHAAGVAALHVPEAGIVDYKAVVRRLAELVAEQGGEVVTGAEAIRAMEQGGGVVVETARGAVEATQAVACAGLQSDRVARRSGADPEMQIVPFRGEYYELRPEAEHLCRNLIYPVPDPNFPFLGVHFTRMVGGGVECGPNAVLAFAREGYTRSTVNVRDLLETLGYVGFRRLAKKHLKAGLGEMRRSISKAAFVKALQVLVPEIRAEHLVAAPAGVRAQAVRPDGGLVDDFALVRRGRVLHVLNAPSPAATASLAIADRIVDAMAD
ncbi:MAG: L-2-hydroxyglutarate oxidase [Rhodothermales bacterium]|nr:L-2-hydroxyglutarate oxidase [Rhodothermales bacterium]MCA0268050.1 L-2-hydroxyglutarate oxidase [Bacteroidota bacterium]